jgi:hypothetical protein
VIIVGGSFAGFVAAQALKSDLFDMTSVAHDLQSESKEHVLDSLGDRYRLIAAFTSRTVFRPTGYLALGAFSRPLQMLSMLAWPERRRR